MSRETKDAEFTAAVREVLAPIEPRTRMWNPPPARRAVERQVELRWLKQLNTGEQR